MLLCPSLASAAAASAALSAGFVLSIYVWRGASKANRDDPDVIRRRFLSVGLFSFVAAPLIVAAVPADAPPEACPEREAPLAEWLGVVPAPRALPAAARAVFLVLALYLGPIVHGLLDSFDTGVGPVESLLGWAHHVSGGPHGGLVAARNIAVAPLCEEVVFRGALCSVVLAAGGGVYAAVFLPPVLFGLAHLHHVVGLVRQRGMPVARAAAVVSFQLLYTTVFGAFAAYLFVRTGSVVAAFAAHALCNALGVPDMSWTGGRRRGAVGLSFVAGIVLFAALLGPVTEPGEGSDAPLHWRLVLSNAYN